MTSVPPPSAELIFCIPILNDWESASLLLGRINTAAVEQRWQASVMFVDDGSTESEETLRSANTAGLYRVEILRLRRNLGHQRAIAIGLTFIAVEQSCHAVVVMDGDGEDAPEDVLRLWEKCAACSKPTIVFAQRARRTEGPLFRACYFCFKAIHRLLTGRPVEVGNFSIIPHELLDRLVGVSDLWNHYAASVIKGRLPNAQTPIARAHRLRSDSKMSFVSLVTHGLSAISVFGEEVGVRLIIATGLLIATTFCALGAVLFTRFFTELAIPGWATVAAGFLVLTLLNALMMSGLFSFTLLQARNTTSFLPLRDFRHYILRLDQVTPTP